MNLNAPRFIPSGGFSRIIAALDAENAALSTRAHTRNSPPATARPYSHSAAQPEPAQRPRIQPFILQPGVTSTSAIAISSIFHPPAPITTPPPHLASTTPPREARKALARAAKDLEKLEHLRLPLYTAKDTIKGTVLSNPEVVYSQDADMINELVTRLVGPLGLDLEWRPCFRAGEKENKVATIQICDATTVIVAQIAGMTKIPSQLKTVLETPDIIKCGLAISGDGSKLLRDWDVAPKALLDLGQMAIQADSNAPLRPSLQFLVGKYLQRNLDKGKVRTSNWERKLTQAQIDYAANDAFCGLQVYYVLKSIASASFRTLTPSRYTFDTDRSSESSDTPSLTTTSTPPVAAAPSSRGAVSSVKGKAPGKTPTFVFGTTTEDDIIDLTTPSPSPTSKPGSTKPTYAIPVASRLWHITGMGLDQMCGLLRTPINPLKRTTVIGYVVEAIRIDPSLPYRRDALSELINTEPWTQARYAFLLASLT
ncbi:ribonuclease H-like protein [Auriculariales sp. MPI-PUGE-AT-0066]|nr:ribonuclease H-like protein [Auriculariales sp. MPI-PUGE-AT-0066]